MSDEDRGTYSPPTEDHLSYESRRPVSRDQAPVTLIISGICLVVLLLIVVLLYNSGLNKHGKLAPVVGDSIANMKDAQVQDAQPLSDSDTSLDETGQPIFAPSAEAPVARDLAPPTAAPISGPLPSQAGNSAVAAAAPAQASSQVVSQPAAPVDNTPVPGAPVAKPVVKPAVAAPAAAKPAAAKPVAAKPVAASGGAAVQIGAYDSTDTANAEYARVASSYGLFVGGAGKRVEKVQTANGTFYRTTFTGLTPEKAKAFCAALKANGRDCIIR
ncbi:SPOR domain-containing protein [Asticcacaulis sp. EMRT-3]|uniref:SPOR domain-containing protein n=1 Tax=Asticcacaulis sp. EMRT-3 TaxID=3040349 RepID=UPI0024AED9C3|nr:SPOR domain-containing protein [Asticcacaulis sp. EMRT-3]MDI7774305.1 SPOR domain-containing protein [Asticcacaulis sp. EMRT-3]